MSVEISSILLPEYQSIEEATSVLNLPISSSELHGIMCGYLCAGAEKKGESYISALTINSAKKEDYRIAARALFDIFSISQLQIENFNFNFQLLLPEDQASLLNRAKAFSEWCEGFTQGLVMAGIPMQHLPDEINEIIEHIREFSQLDYESLEVSEDDEKAFMEVTEYTRMGVLRLYCDINQKNTNTTH